MNQLITALIPYVVPSILIVAGYLCHLAINYIPAQQRAYLDKWANMVVAMVEQQFAGKSDEEKKQLAMDELKAFFKAFNLPCPPDAILSTAIEAAVKFLSHTTLQGGKSA
jgi:LL-H family phage holin